MKEQREGLFDFESFRLDSLKRQLLRDDKVIPLTSKAFTALLILVSRRGEVVTKDELMNLLWFDTAVEENNLTQQISTLRKRLGEKKDEHRFIVTVPGQGYSFVAPVKKRSFGENELVLQEITQSSITIDICDEAGSSHNSVWFSRILERINFTQLALTVLIATAFLALSFWLDSYKNTLNSPRTIVVLPFKSLTNNSQNDFLTAGITETLTAKIGNLKSLTLRPLDSSSDFIGQEQNPIEAGRQLKVDTVVAGSIQREGDRIRITVQVLDVITNRVVWGQSFNKDSSDSFSLQDAVSEEIATALQVRFTG